MKKILYLFIAASTLLASCDKDFEEVNTSPNNSLTTDANLLLANGIVVMQNTIYNAQIGGDMGLCWSQQWSKVQYNSEERYIPRRALMNALWDNLYADVIGELKSAYEIAGENGNTNLQAAALVLQANAFQILTDTFGPVPFNEVGDPTNFPKPTFDSQEVVYDGILALLTEAESLFASGNGEITSTADLIYGGDVTKWRRFCASLKLKVLMRISGKRDVSGEVQALVNSGLLMSSNSDSAQLTYTSSQPDANPIYETIVYNNRVEYKVSSILVDALTTASDPRLEIYAQVNDDDEYVGNIPGIENVTNFGGFSSPGSFYLEPTLPGVILSYAQVEFYLAEAALEGIISGDLAQSKIHYYNGINASLDFNEVSTADAATFTSQLGLEYGDLTTGRQKIGYQMWVSLYGQGLEAWTEWRRTKQPSLSPVVDAAISEIPSRFYYNTNSQNYNQDNYQAAVSTLSNGDTMLSKVWWMQ